MIINNYFDTIFTSGWQFFLSLWLLIDFEGLANSFWVLDFSFKLVSSSSTFENWLSGTRICWRMQKQLFLKVQTIESPQKLLAVLMQLPFTYIYKYQPLFWSIFMMWPNKKFTLQTSFATNGKTYAFNFQSY